MRITLSESGMKSRKASGAHVYACLLKACGISGFRYSALGLRDGLLAQMAAEYDTRTRSHRQLESDRQDVLMNISRRYQADPVNAGHVRKLALALFDQTRSVHRLHGDFREWIGVAAMLYEVGSYVNPVGRHRHAYYIISHSELFGFTPLQRKIIATIARFQGNSRPQLRDRLIKVLPAHVRTDVIKATSILRLGRALNQGRREAVRNIRAVSHDGQVIIYVKAARGGANEPNE
jgi:exopolyphosphatase / guanosine-5'-triphosphate,3'-diphosphate pyrophosphatase